MASRTKLIGVQEYDRDGELDYFIKGSQWLTWYAWKLQYQTREEIKDALMVKFERAVDFALAMDVGK